MAIVAKDDNIRIERLELGPYGTNAYLVVCLTSKDSVLVDAPAEAGKIMERLQGTNPRYILITHTHFDHLGALSELQSKLGIPIAIHTLEAGNIPSDPEILLNYGTGQSCR